MFLKMPILNKIQNVYRASRKLRPGMRIFERCKSSRLPPRFVNSRRGVTGGDILKDDYQKDFASDAEIHSKLRIEEPESGLVLDVNLKYSFRKIPGNLPPFESVLEGDSKRKNIKKQPEHVWYDFIPDVDPDVLDLNRQFMFAERTNNSSMVSKSKVVTRKLSGSSLSSGKSHRQGKRSGRKSTVDKYKTKVSGKIDITSAHFNPQQFSEALHGVVQNVMANSFHTLLQKVSEDQMQDRARNVVTRTLNPSRRRLSLKSSRSTSSHNSGVSRRKYGNPSIGSTESSKKTKGTWEKKNVAAKKSKEALKAVAEISNTNIASSKKEQPLKSSVIKSKECSIEISSNKTSKEVEPTKTAGSDTFMQDFNFLKKFANEPFTLASTHINPSTPCTNSKKKIPADEIPPFYYIVPKLKEHEESKNKLQDEKVRPSLDNADLQKIGAIQNSARETKSTLRSVDGAHSKAPFLIDCHSNIPKPSRIGINTSDKSNTVDSVKSSKLVTKEVNPRSKQSKAPTTENLDQAVREFRALYANFINSVKTGNNQKPDCEEGQCLRNSPKLAPDAKLPSHQGKPSCGQIDEKTAKEIKATILKNLQDSLTDDVRHKTAPETIQKKALKQQEDTSILKATEKELQKAIQSDCSKPEIQAKGSTESHNKNSSIKDTTGVQSKDLHCETNKSPSSKASCQNGPSQPKKDAVADTKSQAKQPLTSRSHSACKGPRAEKAEDGKKLIDCNKFRIVADQTTKVFPTVPNCPNQGTNPKSLLNAPSNTQNVDAGCTRDNAKPIPKSSAKDCLESSEKSAGFSTCEKQVPETKPTGNQTGLKSPAKNSMSFKMGEPTVEIRPVSHTFKKFEKASSLPSDCSKFKVLKVNKTDSPISLEKISPDPNGRAPPKSADKAGPNGLPSKSKKKSKSKSDPLSPKQHENKMKEDVPRGKAGQEPSSTNVTGDMGKARSQPEKSVKPKQTPPEEDGKESSPVDCSKYDTKKVISIDKSRKVAGKDGLHLREKDTAVNTEQESCAASKEKPVDKIKRGTSEVLCKDESKADIKSKSQSKEKPNDLKRSKSNESIQSKKSQTPEDKIPSKIPGQACSMPASTAAKTMSNLSSKQAAQLAGIDCSKFKSSESFISKSVSNSENKNKSNTKPIDCSEATSASKPPEKTCNQSTIQPAAIDYSKFKSSDSFISKSVSKSENKNKTDTKPLDCSKNLSSSKHLDKTSNQSKEGGAIDCSKYVSDKKLDSPKQSDSKGNSKIDCSKYITLDKPPKTDSAAKTACSDGKLAQKDSKPSSTTSDKTMKAEQKGFQPIDCSKYKSASTLDPKQAKQSDCAGSKSTAVEGKTPAETSKTNPIDCSKYKTDPPKTTDKTDSGHYCDGSGDCCKADGSHEKTGDCCTPDGSCKKSGEGCKATGSHKNSGDCCTPDGSCRKSGEGCKADGSCKNSNDCCKANGSSKKSGDCCTSDGSCKKSGKGCKADGFNKKSGDCCTPHGSCKKSGEGCKADGSNEKSSDCCGNCGGAADCCKVTGSGGGSVDSNVRTYGTQPKKEMVIDCEAWNRPGTCVNGEAKPKTSSKSDGSAKREVPSTDPSLGGDHCYEPLHPDKPFSQNESHKSTISERLKAIDCSKYRDSFKADSTVSCKYEITPTSAKLPVQTGSHTPRSERVEIGQHKTSDQSKSSNTSKNEQVETKKSVSETAIRTCSNTLNQANNNPTEVTPKKSKIVHPVEPKRSSSDVRPKPCSSTLEETSAPSSENPVETKESKITHPVETKRSSSELTVKPCSNTLNVSSILKKSSNECPQTPIQVKSKESNVNQAVETKKSTSETRIRPCSNVLDEASKLEMSKQLDGKSLDDACCKKRKGSRVEIKPYSPYKPPTNPDDAERIAPQDEKKQSKIPSFFRKSQKPDKNTQTMSGVGNKHETRKSVGFQTVTPKARTCQPVMCAKQKLEPTPPCRTTPVVKADVAKRIQVHSTPAVFNCCLKVTGKKKVEVVNCPMPTLCDDSVIIKMHSVGLCCSDVYMFENGIEKIETADISLGHEGAGEIFEVGPKVQSLKKGDRVCIEAGVPCGRCKYCKEGRYNICPNMHFSGLLSTYCCHPASLCHKIPDSMSYEEAALVHPLSLGLQACHHGKVSIGSKVLILGACPLGLSALMAARAMGADKIIIVDILQKNLDVASELCADVSMVAAQSMSAKDLSKEILSKTKCRPNVVIDCCGCSKTVNMAVDLVEQGGSFVLAGCQAECVTLPTLTTLAKELCFHTSFRSSNMFPSAINLIKTGRACVTKMITHRTEFCSTQGGFEIALQDTENRAIKVMVNWPHENASKK